MTGADIATEIESLLNTGYGVRIHDGTGWIVVLPMSLNGGDSVYWACSCYDKMAEDAFSIQLGYENGIIRLFLYRRAAHNRKADRIALMLRIPAACIRAVMPARRDPVEDGPHVVYKGTASR